MDGCTHPTMDMDGCTHPTMDMDGCTHPMMDMVGCSHPRMDMDGCTCSMMGSVFISSFSWTLKLHLYFSFIPPKLLKLNLIFI